MNLGKWEPCEACKEGFSVMAEKYNATELVFSPKDKPPTIGAYGDDEAEVEVAYCPKCGRPLTEEAGKLLGKRIASCDLTEDEISFLVECVKMAEQEGFYTLECYYDNFEAEKVGMECLRKIGIKESDIKYCFNPHPAVLRGEGRSGMITELYCRNCDRHTRHTFTGNFKDGIRLLGRYVCNDCGTEQEDEPRGAEEALVEELRRLAVDVQRQKNRVVEAVWRAIVGNDTPKKDDGELTMQGPYGPETRYYFRYKGQDVAVLTIKEIELGRFSYFIQSESITPWGVMEQLKKIEQAAG